MNETKVSDALVNNSTANEQLQLLAKNQLKLLLDNKMFRAIFNSIHDGIVVTDLDGSILFYNHALLDILGLDKLKDSYPTGSFEKYFHEYKPDKVTPWPANEGPLSRALRGKTTIGEIMFIKNNKNVFISAMAVPLRDDEKSNPVGGLVMYRHIQELSGIN